jgi:iron(III) transport system permease protein
VQSPAWGIRRALGPFAGPAVVSWLALICVVGVAVFMLYMTFVATLPTSPEYTLRHWAAFFRPYVLTTVVPNTIVVAVTTVVVAAGFAVPLAWLLNATSLPLARFYSMLIAAKIAIPGFITAMGWTLIINPRSGLLNQWLGGLVGQPSVPFDVQNPVGMGWVMGLVLTSPLFLLLSGPVRSLGSGFLEASAVAGASGPQRLRYIVLPLMWPAVLGGMIYTGMSALSIFEIPALLGGASGSQAVLATELFYAAHPAGANQPVYGAAGVFGVIVSLAGLVGLYYYYQVLGRSSQYATISAMNHPGRVWPLSRGGKIAGTAFVWLFLLLGVLLPLFMLVWNSLLPFYQPPSLQALGSLTLRNYNGLLSSVGGIGPFTNTLVLLLVVPLLVVIFCFATSYVVVRSRLRMRKAMDTLAMLPHAIPHVAIAFSVLMFGLVASSWLPLIGTMAIIVVAQTIAFLAGGTRIMNAALLQISPDLEEAARVAGAQNRTLFAWVTLPLVRDSLVFCFLWTALLAAREVSMALFLAGTNNRVFAVAVWILWQGGLLAYAAAAGVVLVLAMSVVAILALVVGGRATQRARP